MKQDLRISYEAEMSETIKGRRRYVDTFFQCHIQADPRIGYRLIPPSSSARAPGPSSQENRSPRCRNDISRTSACEFGLCIRRP